METHPPEIVESIVERLVPPACREHVMGDLYERYRSPRQYIVDALRTVPFVVASQVRRQSDPVLVISQACGLYISFTAVSMFAGPGYLYEHSALVPLVIVIGVALLALVLCDIYRTPAARSSKAAGLDAALAIAAAFLSQAVLRIVSPSLMLPPWVTVIGGGISLMTLRLLRQFFPAGGTGRPALAGGTMSPPDDLRRRARELHKTAWRENLAWLIGAVIVLATMPDTVPLRDPSRVSFIIVAVTVIGVFVAWFRFKEGKVGRSERWTSISAYRDPYRRKLAGKRDSLRFWSGTGTRWDLGGPAIFFLLIIAFPFLLILLGWILRQPLPDTLDRTRLWLTFGGLVLLVVWWMFVRKVNERAARAIQREIDALDASEKKQ